MKIGICGPQSVGKTTLLNALRSERVFKDYSICNEVTRTVKSWGQSINEGGTDLTQRMIMLLHLENVTLHDNMITDRTALDCLVYARYLHKQQQLDASSVLYCNAMFWKIWPQYDAVFFIKPEFCIEDDGVRSVSVQFRDQIQKEFVQVIEELELYKDRVYYLTGSVAQRVNQVLTVCKENYNVY